MPLDAMTFGSMVEALGVAVGAAADRKRQQALAHAGWIHAQLAPEDTIRAFATAVVVRDPVLVACTDREILVGGTMPMRIALDDVVVWNVREAGWVTNGAFVVEEFGGTQHAFEQMLPVDEIQKMMAIIDDQYPGELVEALGVHAYPPGPRVGSLGDLAVYEDRIILPDGRCVLLSAETEAHVDASGSVAATRGRDLAAKGLGTLFLGPVGLFGMGNARVEMHDYRELYLSITDPQWSWVQQYDPSLQLYARSVEGAINAAARRLAQQRPAAQPPQANGEPDALSKLERLAALHERGALTDEEFAAQKRLLLDQL